METPEHGQDEKRNDTAESETQKKQGSPFGRLALIAIVTTIVLLPIGWIYIPMRQAESYRLDQERALAHLRGEGPPSKWGTIFDTPLPEGLTQPRVAQPPKGYNGFDVENAQIPLEDIWQGGAPRDGIPAIDHPKFTSAGDAGWLQPGDRVLGLFVNGEARAYPQRIVAWHELVDDTIGGVPVVVSYSPLCGTSMVFERTAGGKELVFRISGLRYNSDALMYDRQTESLWSRIQMAAVSGKMAGTRLTLLASEETTWAAWRAAHPDTAVLSRDATGDHQDYDSSPYRSYANSPKTKFSVPFTRQELEKKDWVFGLIAGGHAKAYALSALGRGTLEDEVNGTPIRLTFEAESEWARAENTATGEQIPLVRSYWFAWQAFYPDTQLHQ